MIARRTILKVNNSEYDILRFNYKFHRDIDAKGRPCSNYYGGEISVMLESTDNIQLFQQMIHKDMPTVDGTIEVFSGDDEVCIRRIEFKESYIYSYGEQMQGGSGLPMLAALSISPMRLNFNNNMLRLDRKWPRAKHGWQKYEPEEVKYVRPEPQVPPTPLVNAVKGETSALPNTEIEYSVTSYNISVSQSDKDRVKWVVEVDGKQEIQKQQGEKIKFTIKEEWIGKEIKVMPYLKKPNPDVSVKTLIKKSVVLFFIGGAGDKSSFMGQGPNGNIIVVQNHFKNQISQIKDVDCHSVYLGYDEIYPESDITNYALTQIKSKDTPIYIIGHSFGGWNGAHLSRILVKNKYKVKLLITLDPVSGSTGVGYFADLFHDIPIPVGADFWINITTDPDSYDVSDFVADMGKQWRPKVYNPNIYHRSKQSHWNAGGIFKEKIKENKSACDFLIELISN